MSLDGAALMLRHSRHAGVLTTLSLHCIVWIVDLLLRHVATLRNTWHAAMVGREGGDLFGRFGDIARVNAILVAGWFWSIETRLEGRVRKIVARDEMCFT